MGKVNAPVNVAFSVEDYVFSLPILEAECLQHQIAAAIAAVRATSKGEWVPLQLDEDGNVTKLNLYIFFAQKNTKRLWVGQKAGSLWTQICRSAANRSIPFAIHCSRCGESIHETCTFKDAKPHAEDNGCLVMSPETLLENAEKFLASGGHGYRGPGMKGLFKELIEELGRSACRTQNYP